MGKPDSHGSAGGMAGKRRRELRNARSMNFSAPRTAGPAARITRKTAVAPQKTAAANFSSEPQTGAVTAGSGGRGPRPKQGRGGGADPARGRAPGGRAAGTQAPQPRP